MEISRFNLEILYQDDDLLVINKPAGIVTETDIPEEDSLLKRVSASLGRTALAFHRLDRETSGCILFGRTARFNRQIAEMFLRKRIRKEYLVLVEGEWPQNVTRVATCIVRTASGGWANGDASGKRAVTTFQLRGRQEGQSLLRALPKTGRTHQIRLHCAHVGCPVVGDPLYGKSGTPGPLMLHARKLKFRHPGDGQTVETVAPVSAHWTRVLGNLAPEASPECPEGG